MSNFNKQLIVLADYSNKFNIEKDNFPWLKRQIKDKNIIYTGLTPGPEMQLATYAFQAKIPFMAVIPYKDYPKLWTLAYKNKYYKLLKKAVKIIYVDRQPDYMSDYWPPDVSAPEKENNQVAWLMKRITKYPGITKVISYTHGFHSPKNRNLHFYLQNEEYEGKWHLTQRTHLTLDETAEDDLPF